MPELDRRRLFGVSLGLAGAGLVGQAQAAPASAAGPQQEPAALRGSVSDGKVSLPPLHAPSEMEGVVPNPAPPGKRLGVAVVGLGTLALENIIPGFGQAKHVRLAALVSGTPDKARAIASQYGVPDRAVYDYRGFDRIADDPSIDIVYVVLPNAMHAEYTVRAAQAGKHVLCEKPMATSVAEAQSMVDACRAAKRSLMIAYRMQFDPLHRTLIGMVRDTRFGRVSMIEAVNGQNDLANGQWRQIRAMSGGGSLPDVGLYCFNAFRYLTGEEPVEITAQTASPAGDPRFREVEDLARFTLAFPSGVIATGTSGYSFHTSRRLRVYADTAWMGLDPAFDYDNLALHVGRKDGATSGVESRRAAPKSQFATEMDAFALSILSGTRPRTPGEEGLQDMRVMAAIYQAAAGGGTVRMKPVSGLDTTRGPWPAGLGPFVPA